MKKLLSFSACIAITASLLATPAKANDVYDYITGQSDIHKVNIVKPIGSPFTRALTEEYRKLANYEHDSVFDHHDANIFAKKGIVSSKGDVVLPENFNNWKIESFKLRELTQARGRLMLSLNSGARELAPIKAARAQASFDCWIEEQEEKLEENHIASCKRNFNRVIQELEAKTTTITTALRGRKANDIKYAGPDFEPKYRIFFGLNKTTLSPQSQEVITLAAHKIKQMPDSDVEVVGFADRSGSQTYNKRLAKRRAEAVRQALIQAGVNSRQLFVSSRGEDGNFVPTRDGQTESGNRRVEIIFK